MDIIGFGYDELCIKRGSGMSNRSCHPTALAQHFPSVIVDNLFLGVNPIEKFITTTENRELRKRLQKATIKAVVDKTADGFSVAMEFYQEGKLTCTLDLVLNDDGHVVGKTLVFN